MGLTTCRNSREKEDSKFDLDMVYYLRFVLCLPDLRSAFTPGTGRRMGMRGWGQCAESCAYMNILSLELKRNRGTGRKD